MKMNIVRVLYALTMAVLVTMAAGCGFNRYHQFVRPEIAEEATIEGWTITPRLERLEQGISGQIEEYTMVVAADISPSFRRYRLGIDSVEIFLPEGNALQTQHLQFTFDNQQTEITAFERRYPGVRLPTDPEALYCKLHLTLFNSAAQERWNQTIDFEFRSHWKKKFWIFSKD